MTKIVKGMEKSKLIPIADKNAEYCSTLNKSLVILQNSKNTS